MNPSNGDGAIGIFDSGFGGLTVARQIMERMPNESIIYLGDTARLPYGTKSPATVIRYAQACSEILTQRGIKLLVVACNTASAHAIPALQTANSIPVIGVVDPGAHCAVNATKKGPIGIIGTQGTINSQVYRDAIHALTPEAEVVSVPCPLFVPLAEEGWTTGSVPTQIAHHYLDAIMQHEIDTLVLGCTHYPLLAETIQQVVSDRVTLVDSASSTSGAVEEVLRGLNQLALPEEHAIHEYLVSDDPEKFRQLGEQFLGQPIDSVEWLDF
ncbi:MAG: glutamate racemase [Candidatus Hydrogenedentota bacterium]